MPRFLPNSLANPTALQAYPVWLCLLGLGLMGGCRLVQDPAERQDHPRLGYPHDFTLVAFVEPTDEGTGRPDLMQAQHVIEPDRSLRAAVGTAATAKLYPPVTRWLTPEQLMQLANLAQQAGLYGETKADPPQAKDWAVLETTVTARGRTTRRLTGLPSNAAAADLLVQLEAWRGTRSPAIDAILPPATQPATAPADR